MKYEVGDVIKDKYTKVYFMITKIIKRRINWYQMQSIEHGSTREYGKRVLDTAFQMIQKAKR